MARPTRFELVTPAFGGQYSIQLSYGRCDSAARRGGRPRYSHGMRTRPFALQSGAPRRQPSPDNHKQRQTGTSAWITPQGPTSSATLLVVALTAGCTVTDDRAASTPGDTATVRNIILMIADGAGAGLWTAAEAAKEDLAVKEMSVVGLVDTRSAQEVSDSAAAATVFATGERVTNRTISVGPASACPMPLRGAAAETDWPEGCEPIRTWFEVARDKGRATGLVTTTHVVDATPAAFVAHSPSRYSSQAIAGSSRNSASMCSSAAGALTFSARPSMTEVTCSTPCANGPTAWGRPRNWTIMCPPDGRSWGSSRAATWTSTTRAP
jgi:hypothetical protein